MTPKEYKALTQKGKAAHNKSKAIHAHFLLQCKAHNLPEPSTEIKFHESRKWRFDFCWLTLGIALEVEGGLWVTGGHSRGSGRVRDMEKFNEAAFLGWRVFHFSTDQIKNGEAVLFMKKVLLKK